MKPGIKYAKISFLIDHANQQVSYSYVSGAVNENDIKSITALVEKSIVPVLDHDVWKIEIEATQYAHEVQDFVFRLEWKVKLTGTTTYNDIDDEEND